MRHLAAVSADLTEPIAGDLAQQDFVGARGGCLQVESEVAQRHRRPSFTEGDEGHHSYGPGGVDDADCDAFGGLAALRELVRRNAPKLRPHIHRIAVRQECRSKSRVLEAFFRGVVLKHRLQRDLGGALAAREIEKTFAGQGLPETNEQPQVVDVFLAQFCIAEAYRHGLRQRFYTNGRGMLPNAWALNRNAEDATSHMLN